MRNIVQFFIKNHIWANALIIVTLMFGAYSLIKMNKSFFPELDPRTILVNVVYPGASPQEMEDGVTIKIEQALRGIDGVDYMSSTSSENLASITIKGLENADMDEMYKDVENAVNSINSFPDGAEKPVIQKLKSNPMSELVATLSLKGNDDLMILKKEADKIENDLYASGLISIIELNGFPELELVIDVRENDLLKYGILIDEISLAIQKNNQDLTGGILRNNEEELVIRSRERTTDPREIEKIVLRTSPEGNKITIGDVADARLAFSENSVEVFSQGTPAISVDVKKTPDQDLGAITEFLKEYIEDYNKNNDKAELYMQYEYNASLQDRINLLTSNGVVGLVLVLIVLGLFLSTKLSMWVAFGIPFSFLGMFIIASALGLTINMISLFGMILVVGILVDDGIVIAENIYSHFERGKGPFKAALDGTMEVIPSVFTSVLTTIAAFSILLFVDRMEMMREMPIVVILALSFSLIEAFVVLPVHLASKSVLSKTTPGTLRFKIRDKITAAINYVKDKVFMDVLDFVLGRYRLYVLLPLVFTIFVIIFSVKGMINYTFFPEIKPDRISMEISFEQGTGKEITKTWLLEAENKVNEANMELAQATGDTLLSDYSIILGSARNIGESGFHTGTFNMTIEGEGKKTPVDSLIERIKVKVHEIENTQIATNFFIGNGFNNFGKPIEYSFTGNDDVQIRAAKDRFKEYLAELPLVSNLKDNEPLGRKEINLEMKPEADFYGMGIFEVTKQVRQGVFGQEAQRVIIGTDEVKVWVRYAEEDRENQQDLKNIRIKSADGKQILLTELATYHIERGPVSLKRRDGRREIVVDASVDDPTKVGEVNGKIVKEVVPKINQEFPGVDVIQRGQGERSEKALTSMKINVAILFIVMILIMSLNFSSVWQALLILIVVPAGVAGGILGHSIVGMPVSILSAFGMIALIGILINDSIVFLDTYNRNILEGMGVREAVVDAAKSRFRPILLTSVTTVAGLLPLITETSFQAQFLIPMAVSIAFGLIFGTFFILFFFPTVIMVHNDMRRVWNFVLNDKEVFKNDQTRLEEASGVAKSIPRILLLVATQFLYLIALFLMPILVFFPKMVFNHIIKLIWGNKNIGPGRELEPVLLNKKHQAEKEQE
ncbi:efflux RND transporter permease subunit [Paracrocinitomix mangrovi]|uniref:efflux RND transporter permease subunit n=1 Tax=Paracrocinitomix mangrovi TaxID=2862509 RepID=UPI001C8ECE5F|nr:efflux RND transporter permease subunit [Paracrocinitomix mangrovi]UKN03092.1 efflux RND transporter permease subunit [Paracrocinitomix mangrovi]